MIIRSDIYSIIGFGEAFYKRIMIFPTSLVKKRTQQMPELGLRDPGYLQ